MHLVNKYKPGLIVLRTFKRQGVPTLLGKWFPRDVHWKLKPFRFHAEFIQFSHDGFCRNLLPRGISSGDPFFTSGDALPGDFPKTTAGSYFLQQPAGGNDAAEIQFIADIFSC